MPLELATKISEIRFIHLVAIVTVVASTTSDSLLITCRRIFFLTFSLSIDSSQNILDECAALVFYFLMIFSPHFLINTT